MDKKLVGALLGGYLLGRTKKGKLALMVASSLGAKQLTGGGQLSKLLESPEIKKLAQQVTGQLADATKGAAISTVSRGIDSLNTNLQERTEKMRSQASGEGSSESEESGGESSEESEPAEESGGQEESSGEQGESAEGSAQDQQEQSSGQQGESFGVPAQSQQEESSGEQGESAEGSAQGEQGQAEGQSSQSQQPSSAPQQGGGQQQGSSQKRQNSPNPGRKSGNRRPSSR